MDQQASSDGPRHCETPLNTDELSVTSQFGVALYSRGELIKNKLEFQKRTGTKVEYHSLEPESKKKISKK